MPNTDPQKPLTSTRSRTTKSRSRLLPIDGYTIRQKVIESAEREARKDCKKPNNFTIKLELEDFIGGTLFVVEYVDDNDYLNEKYIHYVKGQYIPYSETTVVLTKINDYMNFRRQEVGKAWAASVIAISITLTICLLAVAPLILPLITHFINGQEIPQVDPPDPPEILTNALAAILGFYFATWTQRKG